MGETTIVIQAEPLRMKRCEAAKFIGVSPRQLQHLVSLGLIRFVVDTQNGERLYPTAELRRYVSEQRLQNASEVA